MPTTKKQERTLPERRNPLIEAEDTPQHEILVERRRLGRTNLDVKSGQRGIANASQEKNLGVIDYAHLRVPLPKDLAGSGIFTMQPKHGYPEAYFLMRRSSDGFVSATGMFKVAFPWISKKEEEAERQHVQENLASADDEVAGNVWVPPETALRLSDEYGMRPWIEALLSPEPIESAKNDGVQISTPPPFKLPANGVGSVSKSKSKATPSRARSLRSASPTKKLAPTEGATPGRKIASPRKRNVAASAASPVKATPAKAKEAASTVGRKAASAATAAAQALQDAIKDEVDDEADADSGKKKKSHARKSSGSTTAAQVNGDVAKVEVTTSVTRDPITDEEVTHTTATVEMPASSPDLPLPSDTEAMIEKAREMVEEAKELEGKTPASPKNSRKRKAADRFEEGDDDEVEAEATSRARRGRQTEVEKKMKVERVKNRALFGLAATIAIGSVWTFF